MVTEAKSLWASSPEALSEPPLALSESSEDPLNNLVGAHEMSFDDEIRILWALVGISEPGHELEGSGLGLELLRVTSGANLDRGGNEDLNEADAMVEVAASNGVLGIGIRRHRTDQRCETLLGCEEGDLASSLDLLSSIGGTEAQVAAETDSDVVTVKEERCRPALFFDGLG